MLLTTLWFFLLNNLQTPSGGLPPSPWTPHLQTSLSGHSLPQCFICLTHSTLLLLPDPQNNLLCALPWTARVSKCRNLTHICGIGRILTTLNISGLYTWEDKEETLNMGLVLWDQKETHNLNKSPTRGRNQCGRDIGRSSVGSQRVGCD